MVKRAVPMVAGGPVAPVTVEISAISTASAKRRRRRARARSRVTPRAYFTRATLRHACFSANPRLGPPRRSPTSLRGPDALSLSVLRSMETHSALLSTRYVTTRPLSVRATVVYRNVVVNSAAMMVVVAPVESVEPVIHVQPRVCAKTSSARRMVTVRQVRGVWGAPASVCRNATGNSAAMTAAVVNAGPVRPASPVIQMGSVTVCP